MKLNLFRSLDLATSYKMYRVQRNKLNNAMKNYRTNSPILK